MWVSNFLQASPLHHCGWNKKMFCFITMALTVSIIGMATIIMAARSYHFAVCQE